MANVTEYLTEIEAEEAQRLLTECVSRQTEVIIKLDSDPQAYAGKMVSLRGHHIFLATEHFEKILPGKELVSLKFFIGTEVFFIKAPLELDEKNDFFFNTNSKLIQLKRRKEPRYNIPERWNQDAAVYSLVNKARNSAKVIDISNSGVKLEIPKMTLEIKKLDVLRIQFQIYKRSEVVCDATVRFVLTRPNGSGILGLEFTKIQDSHKSRVKSIVEDCILFYEKNQ